MTEPSKLDPGNPPYYQFLPSIDRKEQVYALRGLVRQLVQIRQLIAQVMEEVEEIERPLRWAAATIEGEFDEDYTPLFQDLERYILHPDGGGQRAR